MAPPPRAQQGMGCRGRRGSFLLAVAGAGAGAGAQRLPCCTLSRPTLCPTLSVTYFATPWGPPRPTPPRRASRPLGSRGSSSPVGPQCQWTWMRGGGASCPAPAPLRLPPLPRSPPPLPKGSPFPSRCSASMTPASPPCPARQRLPSTPATPLSSRTPTPWSAQPGPPQCAALHPLPVAASPPLPAAPRQGRRARCFFGWGGTPPPWSRGWRQRRQWQRPAPAGGTLRGSFRAASRPPLCPFSRASLWCTRGTGAWRAGWRRAMRTLRTCTSARAAPATGAARAPLRWWLPPPASFPGTRLS